MLVEVVLIALLLAAIVAGLFRLKPWRWRARPDNWAVIRFGECGYWCSRLMPEETWVESKRDLEYARGHAASPGATVEEIFVRLAERHHPDGGPHQHTPEQASRVVECDGCGKEVLWVKVCPSDRCEDCCDGVCVA